MYIRYPLCKHCALTLGDSFSRSNADGVFGTHRTSASRSGMSALLLKADMLGVGMNVCFVPQADMKRGTCGLDGVGG